jgi:hypothetical protein
MEDEDAEFDKAMVQAAMAAEAEAAKARAVAGDAAAVVDAAAPAAKQGATAGKLGTGERQAAEAGAAAAAAHEFISAADVPKLVSEWMASQAETRGPGWGYCEYIDCMALKGRMNHHMATKHSEVAPTECRECKKKLWWRSAVTVHECSKGSKEPSKRDVVISQMISQMELLKKIEGDLSTWKTFDEADKIKIERP